MSDSTKMRRYLVGEQLNAVCFVLDYVELCFDGPIVRAFTGPIVNSEGASLAFPDPGSRDALCTMLGDVVTDLEVDDDRQIALRFLSGKVIVIPTDCSSRAGPEAAHFVVPKDNVMDVW